MVTSDDAHVKDSKSDELERKKKNKKHNRKRGKETKRTSWRSAVPPIVMTTLLAPKGEKKTSEL
jgi:hypothetical protein